MKRSYIFRFAHIRVEMFWDVGRAPRINLCYSSPTELILAVVDRLTGCLSVCYKRLADLTNLDRSIQTSSVDESTLWKPSMAGNHT
jgi:hypothetical protein